jgi:hypothetical protein
MIADTFQERCETCRYVSTAPNVSDSVGVCRRHPPAAHTDPKRRFVVVALSDWCGDYAPSARGAH